MAVNVTARVNEASIDRVLSIVDRCHAPGAAVGIAVNGVPLYRKGFGLANLEVPVVLSPGTKMRIFSITKHFVCLVYLLLCEEGIAGLDESIGKYLPELPESYRRVTMRQIMSHTSGVFDLVDLHLSIGTGNPPLKCSEFVDLYCDLNRLNFEPDTAWCYSNGAYILLSAAISRLSEQPLEQVLRTRIFEPLGMHNTTLRRWDDEFLPGCAAEHGGSAAHGYRKTSIPMENSGDGGIVSTADDMLRWMAHMDAPVVGDTNTWKLLRTAHRLSDGSATGYGFGLNFSSYRGVQTIGHPGDGYGGAAQMIKVPAARLDVVVIANMRDVSAASLAYQLVDACTEGLDEVIDHPPQRCHEGLFLGTKTGRVLELVERGGMQHVSRNGSLSMPFWSDDAEVFRRDSPMDYAIRLVGGRNTPVTVRVEDHGSTEEFRAVAPDNMASVESIVGTYQSAVFGIRVAISGDTGGARMDTVSRFGAGTYRLQAVGGDLWRFEEAGGNGLVGVGILSFKDDRKGFKWMTERTWNIPFGRIA